MAGAARLASLLPDGEPAVIVVVSADGGWKYLSSGAWTGDLEEVSARAGSVIYF
jgi:hypothetical protein